MVRLRGVPTISRNNSALGALQLGGECVGHSPAGASVQDCRRDGCVEQADACVE